MPLILPVPSDSSDAVTLTRLERETTQRLSRYNFSALQRRADAAVFTEAWADATQWTGAGTVVTGGRVYNPTAAFHPVPASTRWVARTTLHATGTAGKYAYFGVASAGHVAGDGLAIGQGSASTNAAISRGANISSAAVVYPKGFPALAVGDYLVTLAKDETHLSLSIQKAPTGQDVWGARVALSAMPGGIADFYISANDTTAGGLNFGPVVIWSDLSVPPVASRTVGGVSLFANDRPLNFWRADPATGFGHYVSIPGDNDPRVPAPVVVVMHQSISATVPGLAPWMESRWANVLSALNSAGYIVAASDNGPGVTAGGTQDRYGNQSGLDDYAALIDWVRQHASTGPVFLVGPSMGSYFVQNMLAQRKVGGIAAVATISGGSDLVAGLSNPTYTAPLLAAYSASDAADFTVKVRDYNPTNQPGAKFRGVPQRFYVGTADTVSTAATQVTPFVSKLLPYVPEAGVVSLAVGHLDATLYQGSDLVSFFNRYK